MVSALGGYRLLLVRASPSVRLNSRHTSKTEFILSNGAFCITIDELSEIFFITFEVSFK